MDNIIEMLDTLAEYQAALDAARLKYEEQRAAIISPEVKQALDDLAAEYSQMTQAASENAAAMTEKIKAAVVTGGASVKGAHLQAVYSGGRVLWDDKKLLAYASAHPEIMMLRETGKPSVSIRAVK